MAKVRYRIPLPDGVVKPWVKLVQGVHPDQGNGWDIQGPLANFQGEMEEGELLCSGWGSLSFGSPHPGSPHLGGASRTVWVAWQVGQGEGSEWNVIRRAVSGRLSREEEHEAIAEFPVLERMHGHHMMRVQWCLLRLLRERESASLSGGRMEGGLTLEGLREVRENLLALLLQRPEIRHIIMEDLARIEQRIAALAPHVAPPVEVPLTAIEAVQRRIAAEVDALLEAESYRLFGPTGSPPVQRPFTREVLDGSLGRLTASREGGQVIRRLGDRQWEVFQRLAPPVEVPPAPPVVKKKVEPGEVIERKITL